MKKKRRKKGMCIASMRMCVFSLHAHTHSTHAWGLSRGIKEK